MLNFREYIDLTLIMLGLFVYFAFMVDHFFLRPLFRRNKTVHEGSSMLLSYYSKDQLVQCMASGKVNSMYYSLLMTTMMHGGPATNDISRKSGALVYMLELPFNTQAHIVGLGKDCPEDLLGLEEFLKYKKFEQVVLEGDFPNYFSLYATPDQQTKARYIFDPAAMQFVVDYCKSHSWEIVGDEMYFSVGRGQKGGGLIKKSIEFVEQIRPALVKLMPNDEPVKHEAPYGVYRGEPMECPVCKAEMTESEHWFECPQGHGKLLFGNDLLAVREGRTKDVSKLDDSGVSMADSPEGSVICPQCGALMTRINYQYTGVIIDTCLKCHYRWCDAGELSKIAPELD